MKRLWSMGVVVLFVVTAGLVIGAQVDDLLKEAQALYDSGKYLDSANKYKEVLSFHREVLKKDAELSSQVWQGFGEALLKAGKKEDAQKAFARAGSHQKRTAGEDKGSEKVKQAVAAAKTSGPEVGSAAGPDLPDCKNPEVKEIFRNSMGFVAGGGQKIIAIRNLIEACGKEPDHPVLLAKTAELIINHGQSFLKEARQFMEKVKALKKDKISVEDEVLLARTLFMVAPFKPADAEKLLKAILTKQADNVDAQVSLGETYLQMSKFAEALKLFDAAQKGSDNVILRAMWGKGYALLGIGKKDEAMTEFLNAFYKQYNNPINHVRMGKAMIKLGREKLAPSYYHGALKMDNSCYEAHLALVPIYLQAGRDMTARTSLNIALAIDPQNPDLYLYQGVLYEMYQDIGKALDAYEYASEHGALAAEAKLRMARIFMGIGHRFPGKGFSNENYIVKKLYERFYSPEKALSLLQEVIALEPNHPEVVFISESIYELEDKVQKIKSSRIGE
jgi:tetratricopeptide (TPR) repeat protein